MNKEQLTEENTRDNNLHPVIAQAAHGPCVIWVTKEVKDAIDAVPEELKRLPEIHPDQKTNTRID